MHLKRNHNNSLPLEEGVSKALVTYRDRLIVTVSVYVICLIGLLIFININNIFQAIVNALSFTLSFALSFLLCMFPVLLMFFMWNIVTRFISKRINASLKEKERMEKLEDSRLTRK